MNLLSDIEVQGEERNLVWDLDSMLFSVAYKYRKDLDMELAYFDLAKMIYNVEHEIWKSYQLNEIVYCLTSSRNFRDDLTDKWKADRVAKPEAEMTDKQL